MKSLTMIICAVLASASGEPDAQQRVMTSSTGPYYYNPSYYHYSNGQLFQQPNLYYDTYYPYSPVHHHVFKREAQPEFAYSTRVTHPNEGSFYETKVNVDQNGVGHSYQHVEQIEKQQRQQQLPIHGYHNRASTNIYKQHQQQQPQQRQQQYGNHMPSTNIYHQQQQQPEQRQQQQYGDHMLSTNIHHQQQQPQQRQQQHGDPMPSTNIYKQQQQQGDHRPSKTNYKQQFSKADQQLPSSMTYRLMGEQGQQQQQQLSSLHQFKMNQSQRPLRFNYYHSVYHPDDQINQQPSRFLNQIAQFGHFSQHGSNRYNQNRATQVQTQLNHPIAKPYAQLDEVSQPVLSNKKQDSFLNKEASSDLLATTTTSKLRLYKRESEPDFQYTVLANHGPSSTMETSENSNFDDYSVFQTSPKMSYQQQVMMKPYQQVTSNSGLSYFQPKFFDFVRNQGSYYQLGAMRYGYPTASGINQRFDNSFYA